MRIKIGTALAIFLSLVIGVTGQKGPVLPAAEFQEQIEQPGIQILDVRTSQEYTSGHIIHSLQADWLNGEQFRERVKHLDKTKSLYVYCGSGVRSNDAAKWLRKNGFQKVFELQNGILSWNKNHQPLEIETAVKQMSLAEYQSMTDSASLVLIDFGAKWCPPCKKMEPVLEELKSDFRGRFVLLKIDAGVHTEVMQQLSVEELPTFIAYKNGKEIWRKNGIVSLEEFKTHLQ